MNARSRFQYSSPKFTNTYNFHLHLHLHYTLILFFFLITTIAAAQPITFLKTYASGNNGMCVREVDGNSYIVAGGTDYYYNFHWFIQSPVASTNIHLFRTTIDGSLVWEKIFSSPGARTTAIWVEPLLDSGFIVTGRMNRDLVWPPDSNDIILLKTDAAGNLLWSKSYDSGKDDLGFCVQQTRDSGFVVSAFHDAAPVTLFGTDYALLMKTDANGNVTWEKKYELACRDLDTGEPFSWIVKQTADDGYVLVGTTVSTHSADVYVIRTDVSGNVLWAKSYDSAPGPIRFSLGLDIIEASTGDFILAGSMDLDQSLNQYNYPYILKISSTGDLLDQRFYDSAPPQLFQSGFSSVQETPDGGFFFTGMGGYSGFGQQAQLLKTDVNFNMQWSRSYTNDGPATMGSRSGRLTSDGGYVFTGKTMLAGTVLLKTDPIGNVPCKIPGSLIEMLPPVISLDKFPAVISGINTSLIPLVTLPTLADTSTVCPVTDAILPVELLSFTATPLAGNAVDLRWSTASEINNDYFRIEKSVDGKIFYTLGIVKGAGNSTEVLNYSLEDKDPGNASILYYRLSQIDYDGSVHLSRVVPLGRRVEAFEILSLHGDAATSSIQIFLQSPAASTVQWQLSDVLGRVCSRGAFEVMKGVQTVQVDAGALEGGVFFLNLFEDGVGVSRKVLYQ